MDLNLLVALDVLLEEGSVGAAADRLGLSQPAMSRTLGRIRRATGDQILVRSGRLMLPTPGGPIWRSMPARPGPGSRISTRRWSAAARWPSRCAPSTLSGS